MARTSRRAARAARKALKHAPAGAPPAAALGAHATAATGRARRAVRARSSRWYHRAWGAAVGAVAGWATYTFGAMMAMNATAATGRAPVDPSVFTVWQALATVLGLVVGYVVGKHRWRLAGVLGYIGLLALIGGYVAYSLTVSIPKVPPSERWISYALLAAETGGLGLIVVFSFYSLDAANRKHWSRRAPEHSYDPELRPKVAFAVPVFNEPFEMVQQTVAHLVRQDYPRDRFVVLVLDDSTDMENVSRLSAYCKEVGAEYVRRPNRRGFKAGALNYAVRQLPADVELLAVIDCDYWVQPGYLKAVVGHFADPALAFVQTPQDYRNVEESFLTRQYKRAEAYFYHAIMHSRNEQNTIIFCGTMGILRRSALEDVGGFGEDQICEDAEISVRLATAGWHSLYVDRSFGHGLMPAVFDAYKKQFHRWAFGNVRIFFSRAGMILRSRMRLRQKVDFFVSNLHWFDGFFVTAVALVLLYLGLGPVFGYTGTTHHQRELAMLALVPVFLLVDGVIRLHLVLRRSKVRFRQAIGVQGMWFAIKTTNMVAVTKCMLGFRSPFVRTPKDSGGRIGRWRAFWRSIRITKLETLLGGLLVWAAVINVDPVRFEREPIAALLPVWLALYALFFLAAPIYAYLSYRTLKPMRYLGVPTTPALPAPSYTPPFAQPRTFTPDPAFAAPTPPRPAAPSVDWSAATLPQAQWTRVERPQDPDWERVDAPATGTFADASWTHAPPPQRDGAGASS